MGLFVDNERTEFDVSEIQEGDFIRLEFREDNSEVITGIVARVTPEIINVVHLPLATSVRVNYLELTVDSCEYWNIKWTRDFETVGEYPEEAEDDA